MKNTRARNLKHMTWAIIAVVASVMLQAMPAVAQQADAGPTSLRFGGNDLSFYGFLRLDTIVSDSQLNHPQYSMWVSSEPEGKEDLGLIEMYPRLTRFGLKVKRDSLPRLETGKLEGVMELDFQNRAVGEASGGSESREIPRLRHGFLKLGLGSLSILAGQTSDLIAPLWPIVNADAGLWNSGNLGDRRPQIRFGYEKGILEGAKLQIHTALGRTGAVDLKDLDGNGVRDGDDSGIPMLQGRAGVASLLGKIDFGLWAHWGREAIQSKFAKAGSDPQEFIDDKSFVTSSIGADLNVKIDKLTISGEAFTGQNLSDLRGGIGQGVNKKTAKEIEATGFWGNAKFAALPWLAVGAGAGLDKASTDELVAGDRETNLALFGNVEVDAGGGFVTGLEYINWKTEYVDKPEGTANRFDLYALYKF